MTFMLSIFEFSRDTRLFPELCASLHGPRHPQSAGGHHQPYLKVIMDYLEMRREPSDLPRKLSYRGKSYI